MAASNDSEGWGCVRLQILGTSWLQANQSKRVGNFGDGYVSMSTLRKNDSLQKSQTNDDKFDGQAAASEN